MLLRGASQLLGCCCWTKTSFQPPPCSSRSFTGLSVGGPVGDATLPYCDRREQHHRGHVVEERRENGCDEAEDDDHGPHSAPGQLISLRWETRSGLFHHAYAAGHCGLSRRGCGAAAGTSEICSWQIHQQGLRTDRVGSTSHRMVAPPTAVW